MSRKALVLLMAVLGVLAVYMGVLGNTGAAEMGSPKRSFLPLVHNGPLPENVANAKDLPVWVDEFVHAQGGKVTTGGVAMDASQLTSEIRRNGDEFIEVKPSAGVMTSFLVVNGIPLAMRAGQRWQEATMATLGELNGIEFECSLRLDDRKYEEFLRISERALGHNTVLVLTTNLDVTAVFGDFVESDWQNILDNWASIQEDFSSGAVPSGYPYKWERGLEALQPDVARAFGGNPQLRSQHLYNGGLRSEGSRIEALKRFQTNKSQDEMLRIFEFVVRSRVLRFPEIDRWDVSDEVSAAYVVFKYNDVPEVNFWGNATGLTPSELTLKVAEWVTQDNPNAKTYITEDSIFDTGNPVGSWLRDYFYGVYIPEIIDGNQNRIVDGVIGENNWWIWEPQDWTTISNRIDYLNENGLGIGGSETMIVSGDIPINDCCDRKKLIEIDNVKQAQADMFAAWLDLYLDKGIRTIGFGNIDDFYAWTQDANLPDANPTIFDIEFRAKPAYYSIVKTLYEHIQ